MIELLIELLGRVVDRGPETADADSYRAGGSGGGF